MEQIQSPVCYDNLSGLIVCMLQEGFGNTDKGCLDGRKGCVKCGHGKGEFGGMWMSTFIIGQPTINFYSGMPVFSISDLQDCLS